MYDQFAGPAKCRWLSRREVEQGYAVREKLA
jgi:hypothetical protein